MIDPTPLTVTSILPEPGEPDPELIDIPGAAPCTDVKKEVVALFSSVDADTVVLAAEDLAFDAVLLYPNITTVSICFSLEAVSFFASCATNACPVKNNTPAVRTLIFTFIINNF